ncbi:MAG: ImmA/IrrE family metallo-endopeptidase [Ruminococcaceae bacterium]|nr:ImmA/IrrE family metallo-endopeptidase [Oscillospiraceae bacterium]
MSLNNIANKGSNLVKRCNTRDPFKIAEAIGVKVMFVDNFEKLKGVYRVIKRNRWIFINSNLSERMQRIVCAHELGHDQLHRHLAKGDGLMEFVLYDMASRPEYEANILAAQILLPDDEVLEHIYNGYDAEQIARIMDSDINLVALKVASLNQQGHNFNNLNHNSRFLK